MGKTQMEEEKRCMIKELEARALTESADSQDDLEKTA